MLGLIHYEDPKDRGAKILCAATGRSMHFEWIVMEG